jgi:hypothetical protein
MLEELQALARSRGVEFKKDLFEQDLRFIKAFMKATIGRSLWGNEGSARVMLKEDTQFQKAVTLFGEAEKMARAYTSLK